MLGFTQSAKVLVGIVAAVLLVGVSAASGSSTGDTAIAVDGTTPVSVAALHDTESSLPDLLVSPDDKRLNTVARDTVARDTVASETVRDRVSAETLRAATPLRSVPLRESTVSRALNAQSVVLPVFGTTSSGVATGTDTGDAGNVAGTPPVEPGETEGAPNMQEPDSAVSMAAIELPAETALNPLQERGNEALSRITYDWASLGFRIEFLPPKRGFRGLTYPYEGRIEVFVSDDLSIDELAHVLAHEIGHAVDVRLNSPDDRRRWLEARGVAPSTLWWAGPAASDFSSGSGDFAECFAWWQVGSRSESRLAGSCAGTERLIENLSLR